MTQRAELCANHAALSRSALSLTQSGQKAAGYLSSRLEMAGYGCEEVAETSGAQEGEAMDRGAQVYQTNSPLPLMVPECASWYAIHTRARHERVVEQRLRAEGLETFLPITSEVHRWSDRRKSMDVPLFSCYVFVRLALTPEERRRIFRVHGILGFVGIRGQGTPIPDEQIDAVRTILIQRIPWSSLPFLKVGQRVRIRGGALDGLEGILLSRNGDHKLVISVNAIQRSLAVHIEGYDVGPL